MKPTRLRSAWRTLSILLVLALALGACNGNDTTEPITDGDRLDWLATAELALAGSCDEAVDFFRQAAVTQMELELEQNRRCRLGQCVYSPRNDTATNGNTGPPSTPYDAEPDDYSETNTQVEGVDEADLVKTDGTHIYALFGRDLAVLQSWPPDATDELSRVPIKGRPTSFFMRGDQLIVLSYANYRDFLPPDSTGTKDASDGYNWWREATLVTIVDTSDKMAPAVTAEHLFDGYTMASRRIGARVYLAQTSYQWIEGVRTWPEELDWEAPADEVDQAFDALRAANVALIEALPLEHFMPRRYQLDESGEIDPEAAQMISACDQVYQPSVYSGRNVLTVVTLNLDVATDEGLQGSSILGDWGNVYASTEALYVGATNWNYYWWWQDDGSAPPLTTHIHKFGFDDTSGVARYEASGTVLGYAINQFAFDEYQGNLRVATTDGFGWWNTDQSTESRVTILGQQGASLVQTGLVTGLGEGEQIYAVRFRADQGYVVTFRQVDPLYVLDLSDPTAPVVLGELKIPGFSSYLHPLDDDHLLAIGRDASDDGQVRGLQFQIFDVSDPADPVSSHKTILGDSWSTWSEASWDHHAFVYYASRGLLAVPVSGWQADDGLGYWHYRSELYLFGIDLDTGITPMGSVSHVNFLDALGVNTSCRAWYGWWEAHVRRGVFVEDYLYSLSNLGVRVHDTRDLDAGSVADALCLDPGDFNGGQPYRDPCYEVF